MEREAFESFRTLDARHFWRVAKRRLILEWLRRYWVPPKNAQILDIGGCCSMVSDCLAEFGALTVCDPDPATVELVVRTSANRFQMVLGRIPDNLPAGRFDLITLFDVLEHVDDDERSLCEIRTRLRDRGMLFLTVPALPRLWSGHDEALHHKRRYVLEKLEVMLKATGFETVRSSYYTSLLLPVVALTRMREQKPGGQRATYGVRVPPEPLNFLLGAVMSIERFLLHHYDMPIGSSIIIVARKL